MKKFLLPVFLLTLLLSVFFDGGSFCAAQDKKLVTGRVTNKSDNNKPITDIEILAYNTVAEAKDDFEKMKLARESGGFFFPEQATSAILLEGGYYEVNVAQTGAIIFYTGLVDPKLEPVNYRFEINVQFELEIMLDEATVKADGLVDAIILEPPTVDGDNVISGQAFPFDPKARMIHPDSRLVVQSHVIDCDTGDTVSFGSPVVYDGPRYHSTQFRRMGFQESNDPLYVIADKNPPLPDSLKVVSWTDTIFRENPDHFYQCVNNIWLEDYNHVYFTFSKKYDTKRLRRPMQFLEYTLESYNLDPQQYRKHPRRERRNAPGELSLTFLPGQAKLDPKDTVSINSLEALKKELHGVVTGEGSTLKEFHIMGVASPEGPYAKNELLSRQRMAFAMDEITSVLPARVRDRVYSTKKARVATWDEVADLLYADSLKVEAEEIRKIARAYPKSMDQQWARIRALPYYKSEISPRLPKLRSVSYTYTSEIYRELTPEEILERYNTDENYRNGTKEFALYEFWHLFNMVKDEKALSSLYRRAMVAAEQTENKKWFLPANNLAALCIKNETPDTTILAPYIDLANYPVNYTIQDANRGTKEIFNPDQVVANQVVMMLMARKYFRAVQLAVHLPEKYALLKAISKCLAGYFKTDKTEEGKRTFDLVSESSVRNKIVMLLAIGKIPRARHELESLPQDDPVTLYLTAQAVCRSHKTSLQMGFDEYNKAMYALVDCFKKDEKFIRTAEADWDIFEDILKDAKAEYEMQKELGL